MKKPKFIEKYGTLTEDFYEKRTLFQKSFYAAFWFQRLLISSILVMMYSMPKLQIFLLFIIETSVCNLPSIFLDDSIFGEKETI